MKKIYLLMTCIVVSVISMTAQTIDQTGNFSPGLTDSQIAYLEFTYADTDADGNVDCAISLSKGPVVAYADYSAAIAIYNTGFKFRNGGSFPTEAVPVIPVPGQVYKMWVTVNVTASTYSVDYQTTGIEAPVRLVTDYGFRKKPVTDIDTWSCYHNPLGEPDVVTMLKAGVVASVGAVITGVSNTFIDNNIEVLVKNQSISVLGVHSYEVFNLQGIKVSEVLNNSEGVHTVLNKGVYVVKAGNSVRKVVVR